MISPQNILPNLSTDGQENATFGAKNTNPQTAISKPVHVTCQNVGECRDAIVDTGYKAV